jgi:hypothetical protein
MPVTYCKAWSLHYREALQPMTEEEAAPAHRGRKQYTALIWEGDRLSRIVLFTREMVDVSFVDELGREEVGYQFQDRGEG